MKQIKILLSFSLAAFALCSSCRKDASLSPITPPQTTSIPVTDTSSFVNTAGLPTVTLNVGSSAGGSLVVDGTNYIKGDNYRINIQAGTYTGITIKNMNLTGLVTIKNKGLVQIAGNSAEMNLTNVSNLSVQGNGTAGIVHGFVFRDNNFRAIIVNGLTHNLIVSYCQFQNIGDYVIWFSSAPNITYNGTNSTCFYNIRFNYMTCTNTQSFLQLNGNVNNGVFTGMVKNLEIAHLNYSISNCGDIVFVGDADEYNVHNNNIHDINQTNNDHNGIFTIVGNGSFHDNIVDNHQGNAIRAWGVTYGKTPKTVRIYNNTVYNSRKYSGFEVQSFSYLVTPGKSTFVNASINNNLCGNLDLTKDWYGVVVDVYSLFGGTCSVTNNTGFNFPAPNPNNNIYSQQASLVPTASNNHYYSTAAAAGISNVNNLQIY